MKVLTPEEARRQYQRQWRSKNKDKVKAYQASYWKRKAEKEAKEDARTTE